MLSHRAKNNTLNKDVPNDFLKIEIDFFWDITVVATRLNLIISVWNLYCLGNFTNLLA